MTQSLSVDSDVPNTQRFVEGVQPLDESLLQRHGVEAIKDPLEGVMGGDAVGQLQEALEPVLAAAGEGSHVNPSVGPGDNGTKGHDDDVEEQVTLAAVDAWVFEAAEAFAESELGPCHDSPP